MNLEELIYKRITSAKYGDKNMAEFNGAPAIFFGTGPEDTDPGWGDRRQYPRVTYALDYRGDPDRQTAGSLYVDVWCTEDGPAPECFEPAIRAIMCGVIMAPTGAPPCSFSWQTSQTFRKTTEKSGNADKVIGVTITFDMYSFPSQETTDPDPVLAMHKFFRENYPEITVIGHGALPDFTEPTEDHPAVYVRLDSYELGRETHVVAWIEGQVICHVFVPGAARRRQWIRAIMDNLACREEVIMLDDSPMFLRRISADSNLDPLAYGQIRLGATWGILRPQKYTHTMNFSNPT